ncbi:MAG: dicarboxylate transporter/tellurite-resistance protein TehA [Azospirillaceae bacterium]|nr:dicarboxylate transporter/tellurite-resistance protein TehA [Azospirillaceae bacterium]
MALVRIPAAYFGSVLGLAGLGGAWRWAHLAWGLPAVVGEGLMLLASVVWLALLVLYAAKWLVDRAAAMEEARHPVQCCFIGLVGVATMLVAGAAVPHAPRVAEGLLIAGAAFTLAFAVWRTGGLWQGERDEGATTPVLYLPAVAGSFVTAVVAAALGRADWARLAFGAGVFAWLAIESVLLRRLYNGPALPPPLRPTLGIQLAPPVVGAVAYLGVNGGRPDLVAYMLVGYGLLQALVLLRLAPWILKQPFGPGYWAFTFGATALAAAPLRMVAAGDQGPMAVLAPILFAGANLLVGIVALGSVYLVGRRVFSRPIA